MAALLSIVIYLAVLNIYFHRLDSIECTLNSSQVTTVYKSNLQEGYPCCAQFPLDDRYSQRITMAMYSANCKY